MNRWVVVFGSLMLGAMIIACILMDKDLIAILLACGLSGFLVVCVLYNKIAPFTLITGGVRFGKMAAGGSMRGVIRERVRESTQQLTHDIISLVPPELHSDVCTAIEGYATVAGEYVSGAVDLFIERFILEFLDDGPAYWDHLVIHLLNVVCGTADGMTQQSAIEYVRPIANQMAANGQITFVEIDGAEVVSVPPRILPEPRRDEEAQ